MKLLAPHRDEQDRERSVASDLWVEKGTADKVGGLLWTRPNQQLPAV